MNRSIIPPIIIITIIILLYYKKHHNQKPQTSVISLFRSGGALDMLAHSCKIGSMRIVSAYNNGTHFGTKMSCSTVELWYRNFYRGVTFTSSPHSKSLPVIVTASSDNHFHELTESLQSTIKYMSAHKIVVFDLGLRPEQRKTIHDMDINIEIKLFNMSAYPSYVGNLHEYRWKVIIMAVC
jgi:hypothetical protein